MFDLVLLLLSLGLGWKFDKMKSEGFMISTSPPPPSLSLLVKCAPLQTIQVISDTNLTRRLLIIRDLKCVQKKYISLIHSLFLCFSCIFDIRCCLRLDFELPTKNNHQNIGMSFLGACTACVHADRFLY
jgi:hypothetical protein